MSRHSGDDEPDQPLPLQEKIGRIVEALARTSLAAAAPDAGSMAEAPEVPEQLVRDARDAWRERAQYLPAELLSDPAWGILLALLEAEIGRREITLAQACDSSAAPTSSAMRWIRALQDRKLVVWRESPDKSGTELVALTREASIALRRYFRDVVQRR